MRIWVRYIFYVASEDISQTENESWVFLNMRIVSISGEDYSQGAMSLWADLLAAQLGEADLASAYTKKSKHSVWLL